MSLFVVCQHHILFVPLYRPITGRIGGKLKKGTQRGGEHGGENIKTISRRCRRHKEQQSRSLRVADNFGNKHFKKSCKPPLCNEVNKNINKTRRYPLFLHAPTVPLCLTIATI